MFNGKIERYMFIHKNKRIRIMVLLSIIYSISLEPSFTQTELLPNPRATKSYKIKYEKKFPIGKTWPEDLSKAEIIKDNTLVWRSDYFRHRNTSPKEVKEILTRYIVVSKEEWEHGYSHVSGGDQAGWIQMPNGTRIQWMIRSAGLGLIIYPDGGAVYLTACRSDLFKDKTKPNEIMNK